MVKITVVIPLYNKARYIMRAVSSVLRQSVQDFEIIVIDDGSTDNGAQIVEMIGDHRIRVIHQPNQGVSAARNIGIQEAKADIIAFLDADDEWTSKFLEIILRLRNKYPRAGLYATAYEIVGLDGRVSLPRYRGIPGSPWEGVIPSYFESAIGDYQPINSSVAVVPRRIFEELGGFAVGEKLGEDLDMWLRIALDYPVAFSQFVGSRYHCDVDGQATQQEKRYEEFRIEKTIEDVLLNRDIPHKQQTFLREIINARKLVRASYCIKSGLFDQAKNILGTCSTRFLWRRKLWYRFILMFPPKAVGTIYDHFLESSRTKL
jgi:glycosyltransferase involved in cell wall biosynthesis